MQKFYSVQPSDTIYNLARKWVVTMQSLIAANNLAAPSAIFPGQQLSIPQGIKAPPGVPWYLVRPGDTLYGLAARYNVTTDGMNRYDLIRQANNLKSDTLYPGMKLAIPYAPPGGRGQIAYIVMSGLAADVRLLNPRTGASTTIAAGLATANSKPYWSPDSTKIAFVGTGGTLYLIKIAEREIYQLDQPLQDTFVAWSRDSSKLVYIKGNDIVIYDVLAHTRLLLNRPGATEAQLFPDQLHLLYAQNNQLIKERYVGVGAVYVLLTEEGPLHNVRLSPDGSYALYTTPGASISLIRTVDLNTRAKFNIPGGELAKNYFPEWAPDSLRLAYSATYYQDVYYSQIRQSGRQGNGDMPVAVSTCFATPVTWSSNGAKLAYLSGCAGGEFAKELWVVDIGHPAPRLVISGEPIVNLTWSPA